MMNLIFKLYKTPDSDNRKSILKTIMKNIFFALTLLTCIGCKKESTSEQVKTKTIPQSTISTNPKKETSHEVESKDATNETECTDIPVEMGSGEECILKDININNAYVNLIQNKEVEDVNYLLPSAPIKNQTVEINKNGLMSIEYQVQKNKITITMSYAGGETETSLEQISNNVKRSIYHYAD